MKNKIIFSIILLICITSCTFTGKNDEDLDIEKNIYKGTRGVSMDFFENNFPDEIFENEELNLAIKIENKGAYDVKNAKILVSVEKEFMNFFNGDHVYETLFQGRPFLQGKTYYSDFNDFHIEELRLKVKELDDLSEYHDSFILSTFCYDYKGIAIADVCIDTDPHDVKVTEKVCSEIDSISLSEGQGGPVIIDRIDTRMLVQGDTIKPQFKIYITNKGKGTVISSGKSDEVCNKESIGFDTYNTLKITELEFSNHNLNNFECLPSDLVLLNNEDFITCTYKGTDITKNSPTYLTPLKVAFEYGYTESISKEIKIRKILTY